MASIFSLLTDNWIPVLRADGSRQIVRPAAITDDLAHNPIVAPAWGRADFDAATREFWIGLLAVTCGREIAGRGWQGWFRDPPSPDDLDAAFAPWAAAFVLDGEGPRFGQDCDDFAGESVPVSQLLIEAPGENTLKKNLDHFVHRGFVVTLSRAAAAISLFTLQTYAPQGGRGNRVSVRGGGPLTTLLVPGAAADAGGRRKGPLWQTVWLAVPGREELPLAERVFPWLVPTRVSDKEMATTTDAVDPLQAFWGMPRRIRLVFEPNGDSRPCDLTGCFDPVVVSHYRSRPYGTKYVAFTHPLSPHRRANASDQFLSVHGPSGGIGYRHWVGLVVNDRGEGDLQQVAASVREGYSRLDALGPASLSGTRLFASGYDIVQNMKARAFVESELPLHLVSAPFFDRFDSTVRLLVKGAYEAESLLRFFVRQALFVKRTQVEDGFTKAPREGGGLDLARAWFWERTEAGFNGALAALGEALSAPETDGLVVQLEAAKGWLGTLRATAGTLFDDLVPLEDIDALDDHSARARIEARHDLHVAFAGYGKFGQGLFAALDLAPPEAGKAAKAKMRAKP